MNKQLQQLLAEVFGTFILVFVGATAVVAWGGGSGGGSVAPFAFGIGLLAALYAFGEISGGHFNPAVSLGLFLDRRLGARDLVGYWIAQFAGAILACLALLLMTSSDDVAKAATVPSQGDRAAFFVELFMTAIFVLVILQVTKSGKYGSTTFVAIALALMAVHFGAVPFSGSGVNPARSFGTALIGTEWKSFWIYIVAPLAGAILAWVIHSVVVKGKTDLRDDIDQMRREVGSMGTPETGSKG